MNAGKTYLMPLSVSTSDALPAPIMIGAVIRRRGSNDDAGKDPSATQWANPQAALESYRDIPALGHASKRAASRTSARSRMRGRQTDTHRASFEDHPGRFPFPASRAFIVRPS